MRLWILIPVILFGFLASAAVDQMEHALSRERIRRIWVPRTDVQQKVIGIADRTMAVRWWSEKPAGKPNYYTALTVLDYDFNRVKKILNEKSRDSYYRMSISDVLVTPDQETLLIGIQSNQEDSYLRSYDFTTLKDKAYVSYYNNKILKLHLMPNNRNLVVVYGVRSKDRKKLDKKHKAFIQVVDMKANRRLKRYTFDETGVHPNRIKVLNDDNVVFLSNHGKTLRVWDSKNGRSLKSYKLGDTVGDRIFLDPETSDILLTHSKKCSNAACDSEIVKMTRFSKTLEVLHKYKSDFSSELKINWKHKFAYNPLSAKASNNGRHKVETIGLEKAEKKNFFLIQSEVMSSSHLTWLDEYLAVAAVNGNNLHVDFPSQRKHLKIPFEKKGRSIISLNFEPNSQALWIHYKDGTATRVIF